MHQTFLFWPCFLFKKSLKNILAENITALISIRKWFLMLCNTVWCLKASSKVTWTPNKLWEHIQLIFLSFLAAVFKVLYLLIEWKSSEEFFEGNVNICFKAIGFDKRNSTCIKTGKCDNVSPLKFLLAKLANNTNESPLRYPISREHFLAKGSLQFPSRIALLTVSYDIRKKKKDSHLFFFSLLRAECIFACCVSRCFCLRSSLLLMRKVEKQLQLIEQSKFPILANTKHFKVMGWKRTTVSEKVKRSPKARFLLFKELQHL